MRATSLLLPLAALALLTPAGPARAQAPRPVPALAPTERVRPNDNRTPAGRLRDGVLTVRLEARVGGWQPEGPERAALPVAAFAEQGKPLQTPGPLIRVPAGTTVRVTVRNSLDRPMKLFGLARTRGEHADSLEVRPGESVEASFAATDPGVYYYGAKTTPVRRLASRLTEDAQLHGVIVVDPPGARRKPRDRVFVISWWTPQDSTAVSGLGEGAALAINGLSWPHTERFDVAQGDSLHWRWVNLTALEHPMHLHGFYYEVESRGNGVQDTTYAPGSRRLSVTELLRPGETMGVVWAPTRPGNWVFHCHFASHISSLADLNKDRRVPEPGHAEHATHGAKGAQHMAWLVLGIRVKPRGSTVQATGEPRKMRLLIRSQPKVYGEYGGYAYVLGGSPEEADGRALPIPGPTLVLRRDEPVAITLVNQSHEAAAVHWHGIELESFPDGVPGWSGQGKRTLPVVPPRDSLTVRFTPPRAGTFMYHSHFNEFQQISSGLYGPIVVLDPGQRYDPQTDRILLFSDGGPTVNLFRGPYPIAYLNGRAQPEPMEMTAGTTHRLRLINIRTDYKVKAELLDGDKPVEWRLVAKDGADLPPALVSPSPAQLTFAAGEIYDFEFTPRAPGELALRFYSEATKHVTTVPVRVR